MFHPLQTWSLGPLTVSIELLFLMLSALVAVTVVSFYLNKSGVEDHEAVVDKITLALIIWIVIFKLWPFILQPGLVTDLRNLIYFSGGPWAVPTASTVAFALIVYFYKKLKWTFIVWESLLTAVIVSIIFYHVFVQQFGAMTPLPFGFQLDGGTVHPVNFYYVWFYSLTLLGAMFFFKGTIWYARSVYLIIAMGAIYFLIAPFQV
ncbi:hypothetical protein CR194_07500 [Salipaludibacillus keqinensis]|uniref:Uncharacterized protein n=1 Tax=Salipaludibacillus keqinensis TaxID=2045207 RepID=A0A323TUC0_9BACI|nr:hypothetical protein [Salipaludibacillus keqinensis]PYZ93035.1 hypothetical protein CR194_07500 [Salipaludibacillus keqinensis]